MDGISMEQQHDNETYLFGLSSPSIGSKRSSLPCLGVYATNKRIFLVRAQLRMQFMSFPPLLVGIVIELTGLALLISAGPSGGFPTEEFVFLFGGLAFLFLGLLAAWYRDFSPVSVQELERRKIFEIEKMQISRIEMKERSSWFQSSVAIVSKTGEKRVIRFGENGSYKHARHLFEMFAPELLRVKT
jgi:hypothetical protein